MKYQIDFSLFSSPVVAIGNVSGLIELQGVPVVGDPVHILSSFDGEEGLKLCVELVRQQSRDSSVLLMLGDCLVEDPELMERLIIRIKAETGLYVDMY